MEGQNAIVIGLGNPFLGDDGVGVKVARLLESTLKPGPSDPIQVTEASVGGIRLMELMVGFSRAILVDALLLDQPRIGTVHRWTLSDLETISHTQHTACAHDTTLITALAAGRRLGLELPEEVTIIAIEVEQVDEFREGLSTRVDQAAQVAFDTLIKEISFDNQIGVHNPVDPEMEKTI